MTEADQRLARAYEGVFRAFLKHWSSVKMVTFWGVNDAVSWRRDGSPLLFDGNNQPKPAFAAVMRVASSATASTPIRKKRSHPSQSPWVRRFLRFSRRRSPLLSRLHRRG